ncbi:MAG: WD40 repeat domain-containing protein [Gemmataceae bacterium]
MCFIRIGTLVVSLLVSTVVVGGERPAKTARLDVFADPLPRGAIARLGTTRWRLFESPLLFSEDGKKAIVVGRKPRLIDGVTGKTLVTFDIGCRSAFWMPDNSTLLVAGNADSNKSSINGLYCLDLKSGRVVRKVRLEADYVSWSADGQRFLSGTRLFGSGWVEVKVWDLKSAEVIRVWKKVQGEPWLSPDGKTIGLRTKTTMILRDVGDGTEVCRWNCTLPKIFGTHRSRRFLFSPDGKMVACTDRNGVTLWDASTGHPFSVGRLGPLLKTGSEPTSSLRFSGDGRYLAAGTRRGDVYLWDLRSGKFLDWGTQVGQGEPVTVLDFTTDAKMLVSQSYRVPSARRWNITTGKEIVLPGANARGVNRVTFSPNGQWIATLGWKEPVSVWDARTGQLVQRFRTQEDFGHSSQTPMVFLPSGQFLASGYDHFLSVWDWRKGQLHYQTKGGGPNDPMIPDADRSRIFCTNCALDHDRIVVRFQGKVKEVLGGLRGFGCAERTQISWSRLGIFDIRQGKIVESFRTNRRYPLSMVWLSPDERTLVGVTNPPSELYAWDLKRQCQLFRFAGINTSVWKVFFSADRRQIFVPTQRLETNRRTHIVHVYELASGKKRAELEFPWEPDLLTTIAIANERLVAITRGRKIYLIDLLTRKKLAEYDSGERGQVLALAFSKDGKTIVTGNEDSTALVWDVSRLVRREKELELTQEELQRCWTDLADTDAGKAYEAVRRLGLSPKETVSHFNEQLKVKKRISQKQIDTLVKQLGSERFTVRDRASQRLLVLDFVAEEALIAVVKDPPSLETSLRARKILQGIREARKRSPIPLPKEILRGVRAVEVLERIGNREAAVLLGRLSKGLPPTMVTREAQASLRRVELRKIRGSSDSSNSCK